MDFILVHHFCYQIVEYRLFTLRTIYSGTELVEVSIQMEVAHPGISGAYPRLYLVCHRMKSLKVESLVALHLGKVISLGYWFISFPLVSGYLGRLTNMVGKDGLKGAC